MKRQRFFCGYCDRFFTTRDARNAHEGTCDQTPERRVPECARWRMTYTPERGTPQVTYWTNRDDADLQAKVILRVVAPGTRCAIDIVRIRED